MADRGQPDGSQRRGQRRPRFSFAWFAGTDLRLLARIPSERRFYDTLGVAVFSLCCLSGLSFALAAGYWLDKPPAELWWVGAGWGLLMACAIEPLVYQTATSRRRYLPLVVAPRVALSLLLAVQIGEPLVLRINQDGINRYLTDQSALAQRRAQSRTDGFYQRKIRKAQGEVAAIRRTELSLRRKIADNDFLSSCEAGTPSCSTTGEVGCGTYCQHYRRLAGDGRAQLEAIRPPDRARIAQLQRGIGTLTKRQGASDAEQLGAISNDRGLPARERALAALERAEPSINREAWFLRLLFVALDLTPLVVKVVRMLSVSSPYEEMAAAARADDSAAVHVRAERARVRAHEATAEAEADMAVASERARARAVGEINRIWARFRGARIPHTGPTTPGDHEERPAA